MYPVVAAANVHARCQGCLHTFAAVVGTIRIDFKWLNVPLQSGTLFDAHDAGVQPTSRRVMRSSDGREPNRDVRARAEKNWKWTDVRSSSLSCRRHKSRAGVWSRLAGAPRRISRLFFSSSKLESRTYSLSAAIQSAEATKSMLVM